MAVKRDTDGKLIAPEMPGSIDDTAVQGAKSGLTNATNTLNSMSYDNFKQGSMYAGLQKSYAQQGQQAMKDTIGQVAARTGGMASSYATTAANQAYNNYMQTLEDAARAMYNDEYSRARDKVDLAQRAYENAYGEHRDKVGDSWNKYDAEMQAYRYGIEDDSYNTEWNHQLEREDKVDRDTELKGILGAEGFLWGDWDGDGNVGDADIDGEGSPADFFAGSTYGEDYWKAYAKDAEKGNYTYAKNDEGTAAIVNKLIGSHDWQLSEKDKSNFDYIFGDRAYDTVQRLMSGGQYFDRLSDTSTQEEVTSEVIRWAGQFPSGFPTEQIWAILEEAYPEYHKKIFSDIPKDPKTKTINPDFQLR